MTGYSEHRKRGPFPGRVDPWAEAGRYFQQVHAGMIGHLLEQIQDPLEALGYLAGRETSLQIAERREPDIYVERLRDTAAPINRWDYNSAAAEVMAVPGVALDWDVPDLHALYITQQTSGRLITIVEIVSPHNKIDSVTIASYQERRNRLLTQGVNVVEIDPTRSVKHLLHSKDAGVYSYHAAIYLPLDFPRFIGIDFDEPLKRIALPLRAEVVPMETQAAYDYAYQVARIAAHILEEGRYTEIDLPFPSLLTDEQRHSALNAVRVWQDELERLRDG